MDGQERIEKALTEREARDAITNRPTTSGSGPRQAALGRYLGAESYHERQVAEAGEETADVPEEDS